MSFQVFFLKKGWPRRSACCISNHRFLPMVYPGHGADVKEQALWAADGKQRSSGLGFKSSHVCPLPFLHPAPREKTLWAADLGHNDPFPLWDLTPRHSWGPGQRGEGTCFPHTRALLSPLFPLGDCLFVCLFVCLFLFDQVDTWPNTDQAASAP